MTLMLHTGAYTATEQQLMKVRTPEPTKTWQPVAHHVLLEQVKKEIEASHLTIQDQALALFKDGERMFGYLEVTNGHNQPDYNMVIGLRNSHDQSCPVGLAVGHRVFVCDNMAFSGEVIINHKHTSRVLEKVPMLINRAMGMLMEKRGVQDQRIRIYKDCEITDAQAHDLMVRAMERDVIAPSRLRPVLGQWRKPAYEDFEPRTVWSLFNAFTHILKENPTQEHQKRTLVLHGLCDTLAGVNLEAIQQRIAEDQDELQRRVDVARNEAGDEAEIVVAGAA